MLKSVATFLTLLGCSTTFAHRSWREEIDIADYVNTDTSAAFEEWKHEFAQEYATVEEEYKRFGIWVNNLARIARYNTEEHGSVRLRMNQFGGMTDDEVKRTMFGEEGGCVKPESMARIGGSDMKADHLLGNIDAPSTVDWTAKGCVTPVKNQGNCGSCWAFSTTGSIECRSAIGYSGGGSCTNPRELSEQQLVDCNKDNAGCQGGYQSYAMEYVAQEGGLCSEKEYPYTAKNGQCKASSCGTKYEAIKGPAFVQRDSTSAMMNAVAKGCVSVSIDAAGYSFNYYSSGVFNAECGTRLDHGVLITGYGALNGEDYWLVKNSWGESWGVNGYIYICRNCNKNDGEGECGILEAGLYPTY